MRGRFYYHAWNRIYIGNRWVTIDAALNQFPADVTHIRIVEEIKNMKHYFYFGHHRSGRRCVCR